MQVRPFVAVTLIAFCVPALAEKSSILITDSQSPLTLREGQVVISAPDSIPLSAHTPLPKAHQIKPFETVVDVVFDSERTIGEAVTRITGFIGYELYVSGAGIDTEAARVFNKPLAQVHRDFQRATIASILGSLIGEGRTLVIDHKLRAVSADLSPGTRRRLRISQ